MLSGALGVELPHAFECQDVCQIYPGCNYWSYEKSTRICNFKEDEFLGDLDSNWISGPKEC